jgi:hypothetical protein
MYVRNRSIYFTYTRYSAGFVIVVVRQRGLILKINDPEVYSDKPHYL